MLFPFVNFIEDILWVKSVHHHTARCKTRHVTTLSDIHVRDSGFEAGMFGFSVYRPVRELLVAAESEVLSRH